MHGIIALSSLTIAVALSTAQACETQTDFVYAMSVIESPDHQPFVGLSVNVTSNGDALTVDIAGCRTYHVTGHVKRGVFHWDKINAELPPGVPSCLGVPKLEAAEMSAGGLANAINGADFEYQKPERYIFQPMGWKNPIVIANVANLCK